MIAFPPWWPESAQRNKFSALGSGKRQNGATNPYPLVYDVWVPLCPTQHLCNVFIFFSILLKLPVGSISAVSTVATACLAFARIYLTQSGLVPSSGFRGSGIRSLCTIPWVLRLLDFA